MATKGNELYQLFVEMTGLGSGTVEDELQAHMRRLDMDPENLNTDDIRKLMSLYLDEFNMGLSSSHMLEAASDPVDAFSMLKNTPKAEA